MFDPFAGWSRMMAAGVSMTNTSMRTLQALGAANEVIAARTGVIEAAMRSPLTGDHAELARMVPEKVEAFSRAGSAAVTGWWAAQSIWLDHMQHVGRMTMRGRPPTAAEMTDLGDRTATMVMRSVEGAARLGSTTLDPIHRKTMANARRLKRKATRKR